MPASFWINISAKRCRTAAITAATWPAPRVSENVVLTRGPKAGQTVSVDGPEYETVGAVSNMGIFDPQFVLEYNWYCDEYSLDTISTGVTIGFFMECVQRGFLTADDIGYDLKFGNIDAADQTLA